MEKITTTTKQQRKMGLENWFSRYFGQSSRPSSGDLPAFLVHFFVFHLACVQPLALLKRKKKTIFSLRRAGGCTQAVFYSPEEFILKLLHDFLNTAEVQISHCSYFTTGAMPIGNSRSVIKLLKSFGDLRSSLGYPPTCPDRTVFFSKFSSPPLQYKNKLVRRDYADIKLIGP